LHNNNTDVTYGLSLYHDDCVYCVEMISGDYNVSTRWMITSLDNVTVAPAENSSRDVFDRYTWTQFLQVCYSHNYYTGCDFFSSRNSFI